MALVTGINLKNKTNIIVHVGGRSLKNSLYVLADNLMRFSGLHSKQGRDHFWTGKHIFLLTNIDFLANYYSPWKGDDHSTEVSSVRKIKDTLHRTKLLKIDPDRHRD